MSDVQTPVAFQMIEAIASVQLAVDNIQRVAERQKRLKELQAAADKHGLRIFLEGEFRADPKFMRLCLNELRHLSI